MRETFDWHSIFPSHDPLPLRRSILTILSSPRLVVVFVRPPPIEEHDKFVEAAVSTSWLAVSENGESVPRVPWIVEIVRLRSIRGRGQTWRVKCVSVRSDLAIDTKIDGGAARYTRGEEGMERGTPRIIRVQLWTNFGLCFVNRDRLDSEGKRNFQILFRPHFVSNPPSLSKLSTIVFLSRSKFPKRKRDLNPILHWMGNRTSPIIGHEKGAAAEQQPR